MKDRLLAALRRAVPRRTAFAVLAAIAALVSLAIASAHARYDHSTPGQSEVVTQAPARVDIYTVQDMKKEQGSNAITVVDGSNVRVDTGDTTVDDGNRKHFSVGLKPSLPPGRYVASFKNVSDEDGESDHGQFAFYAGAGPTAAQKALDPKLAITSKSEASTGSSHTGLYVAIAVVVIVVLLALAAGGFGRRRRRRRI